MQSVWLIFLLACGGYVSASYSHSESLLQAIFETLNEIRDEISKKDTIYDLEELFKLDTKLKDFNDKLTQHEEAESYSSFVKLEQRLAQIKTTVNSLRQNFLEAQERIQTIERKETEAFQEVNQVLGKVMTLLSSIYETQSKMSFQTKSESRSSRVSSIEVPFMQEQLEMMGKKFGDEIDKVKREAKMELTNVEAKVNNVMSQCMAKEDIINGDYSDILGRSESTSTAQIETALQNFAQFLTDNQKEVKEEVTQTIQDLNLKVSRLALKINTCQPPTQVLTSGQESQASFRTINPNLRPTCTSVSETYAPKSCFQLRNAGEMCQGVYPLHLKESTQVPVLCDMQTEGGGWTAIMHRTQGGFNFSQSWNSYKRGFGDVKTGDFWLGNDNIHVLTSQDAVLLRIELVSLDGDTLNLTYQTFGVGNEQSHYRLRIGGPSKHPPATYFRYHGSHPFTTFDRDIRRGGCGQGEAGGFWHICQNNYVRITEPEFTWHNWKEGHSLKSATMKVKPKSF